MGTDPYSGDFLRQKRTHMDGHISGAQQGILWGRGPNQKKGHTPRSFQSNDVVLDVSS